MSDTTQRMLTLPGNKRTGLTLEPVTWLAIERLAHVRNQTWQQWCRDVLVASADTSNMTRTIRAAVTEQLLMAVYVADREELAARQQPALLELSAIFNDDELSADLAKSTVYGFEDMGGFALTAGADQFGRACLWIKNNLRDGMHLAIPLTPEQLENP